MSEAKHSEPYPFDDGFEGFMHRIPGRDHRREITHKTWADMNRQERRLMKKAHRFQQKHGYPFRSPFRAG